MGRILIVGADEARGEAATLACKADGHQATRLATAGEALEALGRGGFDGLVFLGLGAVDDDLLFFHDLRRSPAHPVVPVLAVLPPGAAGYDGAYLGAGADRVLDAPPDPATFRVMVGHLVRLAAARRRIWLAG